MGVDWSIGRFSASASSHSSTVTSDDPCGRRRLTAGSCAAAGADGGIVGAVRTCFRFNCCVSAGKLCTPLTLHAAAGAGLGGVGRAAAAATEPRIRSVGAKVFIVSIILMADARGVLPPAPSPLPPSILTCTLVLNVHRGICERRHLSGAWMATQALVWRLDGRAGTCLALGWPRRLLSGALMATQALVRLARYWRK